jgi:predicted AlkP superfamily pyrophosphatase or phosphodiesterase
MKSHLIKWSIALFLLAFSVANPLYASQPSLVLLVTIDQLRGDMPWRFQDRFGPAGFRYLMEQGTAYTNAHYQHLVTTTAAGHATLATGGNTPQHGIAGNDWFDVQARQPVYSTADHRHPLIGEKAGTGEGRSPRNLTSSTFGDELVAASAGKSRVFSVSIKDRGAIIPGGHLGKAYWYSKTTGKFVTSTYYHDEYPQWVQRWNNENHADRFRTQSWALLLQPESYVFWAQDDRWYEKPEGNLGRTFPHSLQTEEGDAFYSTLRYTPMGDQLILEFVKELVNSERVGSSGHTDILAVSFSATDYIGHAFGPNSLESEDNMLRLDRTLQELFQFIDRKVGLDDTLVVLSSDHGVSPAPEYLAALGLEAERHDPARFMGQVNAALSAKFNTDAKLALAFWSPGIYLDLDAVESLGIETAEVERELAAEIMKIPGFSLALTKSDLLTGRVPGTQEARLAINSFHPDRSGNVIVLQNPFWYLAGDPNSDAAMHGSPYNYDNHVPIMMAGPRIGHGKIDRRVAPRDVAPTISAYLGISPPSGAVGNPLPASGRSDRAQKNE